MKRNEEVKTDPQLSVLPKLNDDLSWDCPVHNVKYRLHEATILELAQASAGIMSEDDRRIHLLSLVVQQEAVDGKWEPLAWPKGGADRLYQTLWGSYGMGLAVLEIDFLKKSSSPTSTGKPSSIREQESSVRP